MSFRPHFNVEVELAGAGAGWTDITADVARESGIGVKRGIDGTGPTDRVAGTGTGTFALKNDTTNSGGKLGYYSLHHANKRSGWALNIGCRISIAASDNPLDPSIQQLVGKIDIIDVNPWQYGPRRVLVTMVDWMDEAARWNLVPEIGAQVNKRGDEIMTAIVAHMPVAPVATNFDIGREVYAYALDTSSNSNQSALSEFQKLAASEFGYIYVTADGTLKYEGRYARLIDSKALFPVFSDALLEAAPDALDGASGRDAVLNTVRVTVHPKIVDLVPTTVVYRQVSVIPIPAGTTKILLGEYRDPVTGDAMGATDVQVPIANTDYAFNSQESGAGADLSGVLTVTVADGPAGARLTLQNTGTADGFLLSFQLLGQGIRDHASIDAEARDASSVSTYGERVIAFDMPYQGVLAVGQGAADYVLANESGEVPRAKTIRVLARDANTLQALVNFDVSRRIQVQETLTGFNAVFFINLVELDLLPSGYLQATYTLARTRQGSYWILGTSTLGTDTIPAPF